MADFAPVFAALKPVLVPCARKLAVRTDEAGEYAFETKSPSPFPQHKGHPLPFGWAKVGKAYVSWHLMALYMCPALNAGMSPELKKRMQGKTCFNFKKMPEAELVAELEVLAQACLEDWAQRKWL